MRNWSICGADSDFAGCSPSICFTNYPKGGIRPFPLTASPKATEQPSDGDRHQDRPQRPVADELLAGARHTINFLSSLLIVFRGDCANLLQLILSSLPGSGPHLLKIFFHFPCLFSKPVTGGSHMYCSLLQKIEIAR
jgi:hypothetical protein